MSSIYERMKAKGIDMSWYERHRHKRDGTAIPLDDEECSNSSIYLLKKDGSLWTISIDEGTPAHQVRPPSKALPRDVYICVHCKRQWNEVPADGQQVRHPKEGG